MQIRLPMVFDKKHIDVHASAQDIFGERFRFVKQAFDTMLLKQWMHFFM